MSNVKLTPASQAAVAVNVLQFKMPPTTDEREAVIRHWFDFIKLTVCMPGTSKPSK